MKIGSNLTKAIESASTSKPMATMSETSTTFIGDRKKKKKGAKRVNLPGHGRVKKASYGCFERH